MTLRAEVVVLPVIIGVSSLLGDQLSPGDIWTWTAMVQSLMEMLLKKTPHTLFSRHA